MTISVEDAGMMADLLTQMAEACPVTAVKYEMLKRAKEWGDAVDAMGCTEDDGEITVLGAVVTGMYVFWPAVTGGGQAWESDGWLYVIRQMTRDGQTTLHLDNPPRGSIYANFHGASSPVVVKR